MKYSFFLNCQVVVLMWTNCHRTSCFSTSALGKSWNHCSFIQPNPMLCHPTKNKNSIILLHSKSQIIICVQCTYRYDKFSSDCISILISACISKKIEFANKQTALFEIDNAAGMCLLRNSVFSSLGILSCKRYVQVIRC